MSSIVKMNGLRLEKYVHLSDAAAVNPHPRGLGIGLSSPVSVRAISRPANSAPAEDGDAPKAKGKAKKSESASEFGPGTIVELDFGVLRPQRYEAMLSYSPALYALGMVSAPSMVPSNLASPLKVTIQLFEQFSLPEGDALVTIFLVD